MTCSCLAIDNFFGLRLIQLNMSRFIKRIHLLVPLLTGVVLVILDGKVSDTSSLYQTLVTDPLKGQSVTPPHSPPTPVGVHKPQECSWHGW